MRLIAIGLTTLALTFGGATSAEASNFVLKMHAPNHSPKAGKLWYITVSARSRSGQGLRGAAWYQFLYAGQVVSTQYPNPHAPKNGPPGKHPWHFRGSYRDGLLFPKRSVGIPLTLRVLVRVGRTTKHVDWKIKVHR